SFLAPLNGEIVKLGHGVKAHNTLEEKDFQLHAYQIFELGDILALEKNLGIKGHNSPCPCRGCRLKGVRNAEGGEKVYYLPLDLPTGFPPVDNIPRDPLNLPMRKHQDFQEALDQIEAAPNKAQKEVIAKSTGIKQKATFGQVASIDFARSCPWDWMHLLLENIIPNLISLWTGKFKGLDTGTEDYEIAPAVWEQIGEETADAVKTIPSVFVRELKNIAKDRQYFTAEAYCFWFVYLAPILLKKRFKHGKYYHHMCSLVEIMKMSLRYSITAAELDDLEAKIVVWVKKYERY
ncbi:hypothetical protein BKA70DRAFT_1031463, partial [Coprinopsis sp. MPI-PUGE-AT-0042]